MRFIHGVLLTVRDFGNSTMKIIKRMLIINDN